MDPFRCLQAALGIIQISVNLVQGHKIQNAQLRDGLDEIIDDLNMMIKGDMAEYDDLKLRELAYDIEDFAQSISVPRASGPILSATASNPVPVYLEKIKHFRNRIKKLEKRKQRRSELVPGQGAGDRGASSGLASLSSAVDGSRDAPDLVGIAKPKLKLEELLLKPAYGQDAEQQRKVISIVGCPGVGKTALARSVYDHACASHDFECVAWVEAAGCNSSMALREKILETVQANLESRARATERLLNPILKVWKKVWSGGDGTTASAVLENILANKRYLVFIDDVQQAKVWKETIRDFPENGKSSILIVTTSVHSVADAFSSGSYVHTLQCLHPTESEVLLWRHVYPCGSKPSNALRDGAKSIITKCGGLPLALITVAEHLSIKANTFDSTYFAKVGEEFGSHYLAGRKAEEEFRELRRVFGQCYGSLPDYDHKTCMLSLSIYPRNHPIKSKCLVRRLIAEGLVSGDDKECLDELIKLIDRCQECLAELMDRCIVDPVQICSGTKDTKSCLVNGGMLEFIIHKSQSTNLVTLIREGEVVRNNNGHIRRLSVQSSTKDKVDEVARKNRLYDTIRSLTIIPLEERSELLEIKNCKFLRLLDLEGCRGVHGEFFRGICELVYLKYLSLRKTDVEKIPQEIENLRCLQTLDIRETREIKLPKQVITLPKLAFLFGLFVLPDISRGTKEFLKGKSELHTFGEFVVDQEGFEHIILEAKNLRKVKVRCRDTCATPKTQTSTKQKLVSSVSKVIAKNSALGTKKDFFLSLQSRFASLHSVSIRSSQLSQDILYSLDSKERRSTISRMKLWGKLVRPPCIDTLRRLNNLRKLQLSYTGLTSEALSILQHIPELECLKLQDNKIGSWGDSFVVNTDGFDSLRLLCFQASKLPKLEFDTGSMKSLTSLHLLCPDISQMQVAEEISKSISHIIRLNEVILHSSATKDIVEAWETAAKSNANRPYVNQLQGQSSERPDQ